MKILIDSDVCLDLITGRKPFFDNAKRFFEVIENTDLQAFVSPDSFSNMFYILRKDYVPQTIVAKLESLRILILVAPLFEKIIDLALKSGWKDFEDAMQYYCAKENGCDCIITRNTKDFIKSSLPVYTPFEFLEHSKSE